MLQIKDEVDAGLRAKKYLAAVEQKPLLRQKPLKQMTDRLLKPHHHGLTRSLTETLAQAIKREGPALLQAKLDPDVYYGLVVDNARVLVPDGSYVKTGDTIA